MRLVFLAHFVSGILYMAFLFWTSANGQYFEEPTRYFKKFEFDMMNRGTFNTTTCLTDLMTCLELVKPDVMCAHDRYMETVCPITREKCHDYYGDFDVYGFRFESMEYACKSSWYQTYT